MGSSAELPVSCMCVSSVLLGHVSSAVLQAQTSLVCYRLSLGVVALTAYCLPVGLSSAELGVSKGGIIKAFHICTMVYTSGSSAELSPMVRRRRKLYATGPI